MDITVVLNVLINVPLVPDLLPPVILVVVEIETKMIIALVKKVSMTLEKNTVIVAQINVKIVIPSLSVLFVMEITEIQMMTVIVYPISTKKITYVYLGKSVLKLVLNVIVTGIV